MRWLAGGFGRFWLPPHLPDVGWILSHSYTAWCQSFFIFPFQLKNKKILSIYISGIFNSPSQALHTVLNWWTFLIYWGWLENLWYYLLHFFFIWKTQFFLNQNAICEIAVMFESAFESEPGLNGLTQLKSESVPLTLSHFIIFCDESLSHFDIFYDESLEYSIQNNLEFMIFFCFICCTPLPKCPKSKWNTLSSPKIFTFNFF